MKDFMHMPGACHSTQLHLQKSDIGMKNKKSIKKTWKKPELKSLKFNQTLGGYKYRIT